MRTQTKLMKMSLEIEMIRQKEFGDGLVVKPKKQSEQLTYLLDKVYVEHIQKGKCELCFGNLSMIYL